MRSDAERTMQSIEEFGQERRKLIAELGLDSYVQHLIDGDLPQERRPGSREALLAAARAKLAERELGKAPPPDPDL